MVRESRGRSQAVDPSNFGEPDIFIKQKDLKVFNAFLRETSDQKILANKTFSMLNRLEKAVAPRQPIRFPDFMNFICQPNHVKYNEQLLELHKNAKSEGNKCQLSKADVDQIWTEQDQKQLKKVMANQKENREKLQKLELRLQEMTEKCESQLTLTLRTLQAESSIEAKQTLAAY